jgi:leucyl aminopeptidase (aminopeptidase T)
VFTAPVKNSVNGVVQYNAPTIYQGTGFDNVRLEFKDGKVINGTANNTERLNQILDSDAGARFIGEFAIGFNPHILQPMRDILFDEKIAGSFHFTPASATRRPRTAIVRKCTGTWSASSVPTMAAVRFGSTANSSARMASSSRNRSRR